MSGHIKTLLERLIEQRAKGDDIVAMTTKTKLLLKGIRVESFTATSPDDPDIIAQVKDAAREMGVTL